MESYQNTYKTILVRILITIVILLFIKFGTFIPLPFPSPLAIDWYMEAHPRVQSFLTKLMKNEEFVLCLFELNIFPAINASLITQILLKVTPQLAEIQKEGDVVSQRYIAQITRTVTLICAIVQSIGVTFYLKEFLFYPVPDYLLIFETIAWLTAGAMIILWCSEIVTRYGIGSGLSIVVSGNILSNAPRILNNLILENKVNFDTSTKLQVGIIGFACLCGIGYLEQGIRNLPLISSKELNDQTERNLKKSDNCLPIRLNRSGVMPIILTTPLAFLPSYVDQFEIVKNNNFINLIFLTFYWPTYFGLILYLGRSYANFVLSPKEITDQLQKLSASIPGLRSGSETTFYLKQILDRTAFIGSFFLASLAVLPNFLLLTLNITSLNLLGTSALLIIASSVLEAKREIDSIYYSNVYQDEY